ncbi:PQQ-dependent sugar dehydrogenase, partial [Microbacteriaceae bacterium K1510]|nr:PQQ-dependent sugar dehydrogenase [Microbacteriaceae bacterium K1510]
VEGMVGKWANALLFSVALFISGCEEEQASIRPVQGTTVGIPFKAEVFAEGLNVPWEMVFLPDGRMIVTERPGTIRVIANGKLLRQPMISFTAPFISQGEGGLLGLAVDPHFTENHFLYA